MSQGCQQGVSKGNACKSGFGELKRSSIWYGILFIAAVTVAAYSSVYSAGFIWDDNDHVIKISSLGTMDGLLRIWFEPGTTIQYYPLVFTAFWAQLQLWGLDPLGFHLVNVVLHVANALLFWLCLQRLRIPGAFWAACLFAVHPLHVETVAWVTELKNILSAFFYLLAFLSYWRFLNLDGENTDSGKKARLLYVMSLILFSFALLSKTVTCTLPAVILLLIWWKRGRIQRIEFARLLPFFMLAVILGLLTMRVEADYLFAKGPEWDFSIIERLLIAGRATWFHAEKIFWPYPLIFNYPRWHLDASQWWQYLFPLSAFALLFLLWHYRGKIGRGPLAACLFVMGTNFPVLGFLNVYSMRFSFVADHYYYIANFGIIALFCATMACFRQRLPQGFRPAVAACLLIVTAVFAVTTWQQGKIYHDNLTLFNNIIDRNPASWFSYSNRAVHYIEAGREDLALADLDKSLAIKPDEADALHSRGVINVKRKKFDQAFADLDRSIAIRPWRTDYLENRCLAYRFANRLDEALVDANSLVSVNPGNVDNLLLRASIHALREDYGSALNDLDLALRLDPVFQVYANRGLVLYRAGRSLEAINDYNKALALQSDSAATLFNRGLAEVAAGAYISAQSDFARSRQLGYPVTERQIEKLLRGKGK